jgi:hypothetical protein
VLRPGFEPGSATREAAILSLLIGPYQDLAGLYYRSLKLGEGFSVANKYLFVFGCFKILFSLSSAKSVLGIPDFEFDFGHYFLLHVLFEVIRTSIWFAHWVKVKLQNPFSLAHHVVPLICL